VSEKLAALPVKSGSTLTLVLKATPAFFTEYEIIFPLLYFSWLLCVSLNTNSYILTDIDLLALVMSTSLTLISSPKFVSICLRPESRLDKSVCIVSL
jgi:hypothetical protein